MTLKVFVYGTLKPQEANYQTYCEGKVIESIEVYTFGRLFHLPSLGYPAMTWEDNHDNTVRGYLLTFSNSEVIHDLDKLETYSPHRLPEANEYQRQLITVYTLDREPLEKVWAYFMTGTKIVQLRGVPVPSGWWTGKH
jgi:gamma-glutamylcyclotransferase (GGCT)/AIG2-like uncharacterized protein YtfP